MIWGFLSDMREELGLDVVAHQISSREAQRTILIVAKDISDWEIRHRRERGVDNSSEF